jgi:hypothetical protein
MKTLPTLNNLRFVSCVNGRGLLKNLQEAAGDFVSPLMNKINLTCRGIFRGKISLQKNQNNKSDLEERTLRAPNP